MSLVPVLFISGLFVGFALVCYLIARDRKRFLVRFDLQQWRHAYYMRALPNVLQALHDNHFTSAWPARRNALAAAYFRFRATPLLKRRPTHLRRAFLQQHIALFALLEILRPYIDDYLRSEQQRIAGDRVTQMEDTIERDRLLAYIDFLKEQRAQFHATLSPMDRSLLTAMVDRRFIPTIRAAHAIFQEHGFSLLAEFTQLRRWEEMSGAEIVHDLPALPTRRRRKIRRTYAQG